MNKAAFLHIVRQVAPIQDQEVDDLEKLVVSFPYCQTAHVLLAKAAHDRGSMLSTQKLRRAAAHASNRQVLKQVIYAQPTLPEVPVEEPEEVTEADQLLPVSELVSEKEPLIEDFSEIEAPVQEETVEEEVFEVEDALEKDDQLEIDLVEKELGINLEEELPESSNVHSTTDSTDEVAEEFTATSNDNSSLLLIEKEPEANEQIIDEQSERPSLLVEEEKADISAPEEQIELTPADELSEETEAAPFSEEEEISLDELLDLIQISSLSSLTAPIPSVNLTHEEIISEITSATDNAFGANTLAPKQPGENQKGEILQEAAPDGLSAYLEIAELYTVYDTSGYEFPTLKLPSPAPQTTDTDAEQDPYTAIFSQNNLAYWMGSSRLGESIQLKDELTSQTPFYFQPELILEHVKKGAAPAPEPTASPIAKLDKQLHIINEFLNSAPKRKTLAQAQLPQEPQEDLSAKSSKIKKSLVSENLALIFVKQGKAKKAIKIYEQLIVKFPEKKSYFAEQIEKLRNEL